MRRSAHCRWLALLLLIPTAGCGQKFGALAYWLGLYPRPKIEAQYTLTKGPLLILVEDDYDLSGAPEFRDALASAVAANLELKSVNKRVVPLARLRSVRATHPDYEKIPADRLGRMVESEQVLWIKIVEYYTGFEEADSSNEAAKLACTVRVLDTRAETRDDVRLWPDSREPHRETVTSSLGRIQRFGAERVGRELIEEMADRIAKLFYTYYEEPR